MVTVSPAATAQVFDAALGLALPEVVSTELTHIESTLTSNVVARYVRDGVVVCGLAHARLDLILAIDPEFLPGSVAGHGCCKSSHACNDSNRTHFGWKEWYGW